MGDKIESGLVSRLKQAGRPAITLLIDLVSLVRHRSHRSSEERVVGQIALKIIQFSIEHDPILKGNLEALRTKTFDELDTEMRRLVPGSVVQRQGLAELREIATSNEILLQNSTGNHGSDVMGERQFLLGIGYQPA